MGTERITMLLERGCRKWRETTLLEPSNYSDFNIQKRSGLCGTDLSSVFWGSGTWAHLGLHGGTNSPSSWPDVDSQSSPGFKNYDSLSPSVSVMNLLVWQLRPSFVYHGTEFSHIIRWKRSYSPWMFYFSNTVTGGPSHRPPWRACFKLSPPELEWIDSKGGVWAHSVAVNPPYVWGFYLSSFCLPSVNPSLRHNACCGYRPTKPDFCFYILHIALQWPTFDQIRDKKANLQRINFLTHSL